MICSFKALESGGQRSLDPSEYNVVPAQYEEVGVFMEPLDVWQNLNGTNFLDLTYSDPAR